MDAGEVDVGAGVGLAGEAVVLADEDHDFGGLGGDADGFREEGLVGAAGVGVALGKVEFGVGQSRLEGGEGGDAVGSSAVPGPAADLVVGVVGEGADDGQVVDVLGDG